MADVFTPEKRSWVMSRIRGRDTGIERAMEDILGGLGYAYEAQPDLPGRPDFALCRRKITIFCDGDFWHGYRYWERKRPAKRFWRDKIEGNMARDRRISNRLRREGWSVLRFWEHDIVRNPAGCAGRIAGKMRSRSDVGDGRLGYARVNGSA